MRQARLWQSARRNGRKMLPLLTRISFRQERTGCDCIPEPKFSGNTALPSTRRIKTPVDMRIAQHDLDVVPGLRKRNRFDVLGPFPEGSPGGPFIGMSLSGVVGRQSLLPTAFLLIEQRLQVIRPKLQVDLGLK